MSVFAMQPQPVHTLAQPTMQRVRTPYGYINVMVQPEPQPQPTPFNTHRRQLSAISQQWQDQNMSVDQPMDTMDVAMDMEMSTPMHQQQVFQQISNNKRKRCEDDQPMFRSEGKVRRIASMRGTPSHQQTQNFFSTSPFQASPFQQQSPFQQTSPFGTPSHQMFQMSCTSLSPLSSSHHNI